MGASGADNAAVTSSRLRTNTKSVSLRSAAPRISIRCPRGRLPSPATRSISWPKSTAGACSIGAAAESFSTLDQNTAHAVALRMTPRRGLVIVVDVARRSLTSPARGRTVTGVAWSGDNGGGCFAQSASVASTAATSGKGHRRRSAPIEGRQSQPDRSADAKFTGRDRFRAPRSIRAPRSRPSAAPTPPEWSRPLGSRTRGFPCGALGAVPWSPAVHLVPRDMGCERRERHG